MKTKVMRTLRSLLIPLIVCVFVLAAGGMTTKAAKPEWAGQGQQTAEAVHSGLETKLLYRMVDAANRSIDRYVAFAQRTPYDDVAWLLYMVEITVDPVFAYADSIGATVVCEYVGYEVDGQTVLIDPIRVIDITV